jgi:hypothetical protein
VIIVAIFAILSVYEFEISDNYFMNYLQKYFFTIDKSHALIKREALVLLLVVITIFYVILVKSNQNYNIFTQISHYKL